VGVISHRKTSSLPRWRWFQPSNDKAADPGQSFLLSSGSPQVPIAIYSGGPSTGAEWITVRCPMEEGLRIITVGVDYNNDSSPAVSAKASLWAYGRLGGGLINDAASNQYIPLPKNAGGRQYAQSTYNYTVGANDNVIVMLQLIAGFVANSFSINAVGLQAVAP
jgi:hypothetical protein